MVLDYACSDTGSKTMFSVWGSPATVFKSDCSSTSVSYYNETALAYVAKVMKNIEANYPNMCYEDSSTTSTLTNYYGQPRNNRKWTCSSTTWHDVTTWGECDTTYMKVVMPKPKTLAEKVQDAMRHRMMPAIHLKSRTAVLPTDNLKEQCARETLRRVLGDDKYKNFLRNGFVTVRARSGLVYQIFPAHGITAVYREGKMTERLCVVLKGDFPPTDSLIMRYLLILNDEKDFRGHAIKHQVIQRETKPQVVVVKSLNEIFQELKAGRAA